MALHFLHYNLVRVHKTLRMTPAMAAGVTKRLWGIGHIVAVLGRGLINTQPQPDRCELYEGKVVGGEPVVARCNSTALLDLVEEPLDQIPGSIEIRTEAYRIVATPAYEPKPTFRLFRFYPGAFHDARPFLRLVGQECREVGG